MSTKRVLTFVCAVGLVVCGPGCLRWVSNPNTDEIPARRLPEEYLKSQIDPAEPREYQVLCGNAPAQTFRCPSDYDLRVTQAVAFAELPLPPNGIYQNGLSGSLIAARQNDPPEVHLARIIRQTKGGGQVRIAVDLNRALNNTNEDLVVLPGDTIVVIPPPWTFSRWYRDMVDSFSRRDLVVPGSDPSTRMPL